MISVFKMDWITYFGALQSFILLFLLQNVLSVDIHVSYSDWDNTQLKESLLFNGSNGDGWSYHIDRGYRGADINKIISIDASTGSVYLHKQDICPTLHQNPLEIHIIARTNHKQDIYSVSNYTITPLTIYFHNSSCHRPIHRRFSRRSDLEIVVFSQQFTIWNDVQCLEKDLKVLELSRYISYSLNTIVCDLVLEDSNFHYNQSDSSITTESVQCIYGSEILLTLKLVLCNKSNNKKPNYLKVKIRNARSTGSSFSVIENTKDQNRLKRATYAAPVFPKLEYTVSVPENQPAGFTVHHFSATDADEGPAGKITYSLDSLRNTLSESMFSIDAISGLVKTTQPLDREEIPQHVFKVTATDSSPHMKYSFVELTINVEDENDHTPTFSTPIPVIKDENIPVSSIILTVRATDGDVGRNADIRYSIIKPSNPTTFKIDPKSGSISTLRVLDREVTAKYELTIQAIDQAEFGKQRSSTTVIEIKVNDENDNFPQFDQLSYNVNVSENLDISSKPVIGHVSATDADEGRNQAITYSITSGNIDSTFYIDTTTGEVSVQKQLDYEINSEFKLKIKASDNGIAPKTNSTTMWIRIDDLNDNDPKFQSQLYKGSIFEGESTGASVLTVRALDKDSGINKILEYSLVNVPDGLPFAINPGTGEISVRATLDREIQAFYGFTVQVKDKGQPPRSATASVEIKVRDINDNSPIFSQKTLSVGISEDAPTYTRVIEVTANDADADNNARIKYSIVSGNTDSVFAIGDETGIITLAKQLDYKVQNRYILTVRASDDDNKFDTVEVHINVTDINKHTPSFENLPYIMNVDESDKIGKSVGKVYASDDDVGENGRITYELLNDVQEFHIDPNTGEITTREVLDRELQAGYSFDVKASDHGNPSQYDTAGVIITVNDDNDNAPKFANNYTASISESALDGEFVVRVQAEDSDFGINQQIRYSFADGSDGTSDFEVDDASGDIRVAKNSDIDREKRNNYTLTINAIDGGFKPLTGSVQVKITIEDINDNAPVFPSDEIDVKVPENIPIGSTVAHIEAVDPDKGGNAVVEYSFEGGLDADKFRLKSQLGFPAIIVNYVDLDYESDKKEYEILLKATSGTLFSRALIKILVQDVNDNAPILKDFVILFNNYAQEFPLTPIGKIPAFDPDVSDRDTLEYKFLQGNEAGFLLLNESTGELQLDKRLNSDVPRNETLQVRVFDGKNEVKATCRLFVRLVTLDMLQNSVTIRINNMTTSAFLSPLFNFFIDALATIINVNKQNIFVISVRNDTDVKAEILNVTVSIREKTVRIDRDVVNMYYTAEFLKEQIYLQRTLLANLSTLQVLPFDDNMCLREMCRNFESCMSRLKFGEAAPFITSDTMLFRPIYPDNGYKCWCSQGFAGTDPSYSYTCDVEVNLCYSNPCNGSGTCISTEEGYTCLCNKGFVGDHCEIDQSVKYEAAMCPTSTCKPPSRCQPLIEGGFRCVGCPNDVDYNEFCQLTTRSFPRGSFLMFPKLESRYRFTIQLKFATQQRDGLLLYNGRFNELHDFIALEIVDGQVQFSFSTGSEAIIKVSPYIVGGVNDGKWHQVTVDYKNMTATVTVGEDCDTEISVRFGDAINYTCAARVTHQLPTNCHIPGTKNCHKLIDLTGPLQIGGLPTLPSAFQISNKDYVGCIKDLYIDQKLLDFNSSVANNGTVAGCRAKTDFCKGAPCQNGGTCMEGWESYLCRCPAGYGAKDCSITIDWPLQLNGDGYLHYSNRNQLIANINFPWYNGISFRTRASNGTLMFIMADTEAIHMQIINGYLTYTYINSVTPQVFTFHSVAVNDGDWHFFETRWEKNGDLFMKLDYGQRWQVEKIQSSLEQKSIREVYVGAIKYSEQITDTFTGCVENVQVGNLQNALLNNPTSYNTTPGCSSTDPCTSNPCSSRAQCVSEWESYTCKCPPGTLGDTCDNICTTYNPCQNMAYCRHPQGGTYNCECGLLQSGQYCQVSKQPCPAKWWGYPTCAPCPSSCTKDNGFESNCNNITGKCSCLENHYRPPGSEVCLPCNCYMHGRTRSACDGMTGQCACIEGVIGRRCDQCPSKYAGIVLDEKLLEEEQITKYSCKVNYQACPRIFSHNMWWDAEEANELVYRECPNNAVGIAHRNCSSSGLWMEPDFFNCTNQAFLPHLKELNKIESDPEYITTFVTKTEAANLADSTSRTEVMFGNDLNITFRIMNYFLDFENQQNGLNLTSEQDSKYLGNMLTVLSQVLEPKYKREWNQLSEEGEGTHTLLAKLETYLDRLLSSLELTSNGSPRPYNVVTENIVLGVDTLNKRNFSGKAIPKYDNIVKTPLFDDATSIYLPRSIITEPPLKDFLRPDIVADPKAFVGYIMFKNIGDLLPKRYASNVRVIEDRPMSVNSPVLTILVHDDGQNVTDSLSQPVVLTFKQQQAGNRTSPQCVFWNTETDGGEWSSKGCTEVERYVLDTQMYVKCSCNHLTSFALLMDISDQEYIAAEPIVMEVITYIGLMMCMCCLVACFIIFFCFKRLVCNSTSIHTNLVFVIFVAQLAFIVGINRSDSDLLCRLVAICLHYFYMTGFSWLFVDILHIYRMLTEIRNIDQGSMKFYYLIAYVIPGIIVSLAVGLNTEGYGNQKFCWLSITDKFIWSFAGPITLCVIVNIFTFVLAVKGSCREKVTINDVTDIKVGLFGNIIVLLLWGVIWIVGLLAVNYNYKALHYIYAIFCLALGLVIFIVYVICNPKVRLELKKLLYRCQGKKLDLDDNIAGTRSSVYSRSALAYRNDSCDNGLARVNVGISTTSTTSHSTSKSSGGLYKGEDYLRSTSTSTSGNTAPIQYPRHGLPPPYGGYEGGYDPEKPGDLDPDSIQIRPKRDGNDSDTDSEMSERVSLDLASSHSSDDDDDGPTFDWEKQLPKNKKIEEAMEQARLNKKEDHHPPPQQQQQQQYHLQHQQQPLPQHTYQNPFDQIYSGSPTPAYTPKPNTPGHWPGDPQLSGYTGSDSEYRGSDQPTLSSVQPDVTLQTPEYKAGKDLRIGSPRVRTDSLLNESNTSSNNASYSSPYGSPHLVHSPLGSPRSPLQKLHSPLGSPQGHMKVKVLTHRGSISSDSECSHETCV